MRGFFLIALTAGVFSSGLVRADGRIPWNGNYVITSQQFKNMGAACPARVTVEVRATNPQTNEAEEIELTDTTFYGGSNSYENRPWRTFTNQPDEKHDDGSFFGQTTVRKRIDGDHAELRTSGRVFTQNSFEMDLRGKNKLIIHYSMTDSPYNYCSYARE